jgi:hypothetical protein
VVRGGWAGLISTQLLEDIMSWGKRKSSFLLNAPKELFEDFAIGVLS